LPPLGKSFDIGVEGHNYEPWSLEEIERKMSTLDAHVIPAGKVWEPTQIAAAPPGDIEMGNLVR
jgi:hypothetical protein